MALSDSDDDEDDHHNEFTTKAKFIYSHFSELKNPNRFVCQLIKANGKKCEKQYATRKSTNLGVHLRSHNNRAINAKLTEYDKANAEKKRKRDAEQIVELPSKRVRDLQQPMITDHLPVESSSLQKELSEATALFFSAHDAPLRWAESPYLHALLILFAKCYKLGIVKKLDGRQRIAANQIELASSLNQAVTAELVKSVHPITLAFDGWQNVNGVHVQNILAHCLSATFFLKVTFLNRVGQLPMCCLILSNQLLMI
jgi:hypothetical protein